LNELDDDELEMALERWVLACQKEGIPTDPSIMTLTHDGRLCFTDLQIGNRRAPALAAVLEPMHSITALDLANARMSGEPLGGVMHAACLNPLKRLDISGNMLGPEGRPGLKSLLFSCTGLRHLDLSEMQLTDEDVLEIMDAIVCDIYPTGLASSSLDAGASYEVREKMGRNGPRITHLLLSNNFIGVDDAGPVKKKDNKPLKSRKPKKKPYDPAEPFQRKARNDPGKSVSKKELKRIAMTDEKHALLAKLAAGAEERAYEFLDLAEQRLGHDLDGCKRGVAKLSDAELSAVAVSRMMLASTVKVHTVDLSWNSIGSYGAHLFFMLTTECPCLEVLKLAGNSIGDHAAHGIAHFISHAPSCDVLDLSQNMLTGRFCLMTSWAMGKRRTHNPLSVLDLSGNPLGEAGGRTMLRLLLDHKTINAFENLQILMYGCTFEPYQISTNGFNQSFPHLGSPYNLNLSNEYDQALLHELFLCVYHQATEMSIKGANGKAKITCVEGVDCAVDEKTGEEWEYPEGGGRVQVTYVPSPCLEGDLLEGSELDRLIELLELGQGSPMDRLNVCMLVAKDHFITTADLQTLIDAIHTVDVAEVLNTKTVVRSFWSRIVDSENKHKFMARNLTARQVYEIAHEIGVEEFGFIPFNPSGHWQLEWHIPHHKVLAIKLAMLNDKLSVERKYLASVSAPKAKDTSQRGDWSCTRNEQFIQVVLETTGKGKKTKTAKVEKTQDIKLSFDLIHSVPWDENGVFKFDFLTLVRPPPNALVQDNDSFRKLMADCGVIFGRPGHRDMSRYHGQYLYALLRLATSDCYCTCEQLSFVLDCLHGHDADQVEVIMIFFSRLVDLANLTTVALRGFPRSAYELAQVRIGRLNLYDIGRAPVGKYVVPIYHVDDRVFIKCLLELSDNEWMTCKVAEKSASENVTAEVEYEGTHPLVKAHDSECEIEELEDHFRIKQVVAKAKYLEAAPKKAPPKKDKKEGKKKDKKDGKKKDNKEGDGAILPYPWFPWPPQWLDTKHWSRGQDRIGLPDNVAKVCECVDTNGPIHECPYHDKVFRGTYRQPPNISKPTNHTSVERREKVRPFFLVGSLDAVAKATAKVEDAMNHFEELHPPSPGHHSDVAHIESPSSPTHFGRRGSYNIPNAEMLSHLLDGVVEDT